MLAFALALGWMSMATTTLRAADGETIESRAERFISNAAGFEISSRRDAQVQRAAATTTTTKPASVPLGSSPGTSVFEPEIDYGQQGCPHCGGAHGSEAHQGAQAPPGPYGPGGYESLAYPPGQGIGPESEAGGTYHFLPRSWDELVNGSVRYKGPGVPLLRESWNYRPWHVDWFMGVMWGDTMPKYEAERGGGAFGGFRLGEDWGNYLGWETRFAFASLDMNNFASDYWLDDTEDFYWDTSVVYYPWGDSLWRPYFSIGLGLARFQFYKYEGARADETSFSLPLGVGLKYRYASWLAFRLDFTDNASFAGGLNWMNSYSLTAGMEFHFGGRRRSYQAWNPGRHHW